GKRYIYLEGDSGTDSGYTDHYSDITSSESEYEEMDINDIYVPGSPKYKTLIEVVLEPSKSNGNTLGDMVGTTIFTDEEWNQLKHDFISQYLQSEPLDVPKVGVSKELPMNIGGNVLDDGINEKPFITSIHDRDLYTGEEINYNINMSTNSMDDPKYVSNNVYSGIDLINDTLSGNQHIDIYDELLKRKENELFGTNYKKNTSNNSVAKNTNNDPIMNQLNLLHKWLDRHRDMCNTWNTKEELLDKLNEEWNKDNDVGGDISTSNGNKMLNTDVSIQIDMDNPKPINQFSNMDINVDTPTMDNMEDDIYYDVNDNDDDNDQPSVYDIPMDHNKVDVDVPKKVHIEMKILNNTSNGSLEQQFPISDVYNQRNHYITRTPKATTRTLCECELYSPANYDNDPEMKEVMDNFNRQTQQRFHEYDECMVEKRMQCKDKCDKEIQKIILKDKLEKQMKQELTTLETKITTDDIPTCVCEKSIADKTEKFCLNCGVNVGGGITLSSGVLGGIGAVAVNAWKDAALEAAIAAAKEAGDAAGLKAGNAHGMKIVIKGLEAFKIDKLVPGICEEISSTGDYTHVINFTKKIIEGRNAMCGATKQLGEDMCNKINIGLGTMLENDRPGLPDATAIPAKVKAILDKATSSANAQAAQVSSATYKDIMTKQTALIEAGFNSSITSINASIFAIVVIVLIMVIIYLILRYRRKKKMKKKLQYIKLLEE
ncbi:hypothetical protein PFAG_06030, partial [Plasmodium falciparum Santa Lucia]